MIITFCIVFMAIGVVAYLITTTLSQFLKERHSKDHFQSYDKVKRFISPERLLQVQIISAFISAAIFVLFLIFVGVYSIYILTPIAFFVGCAGFFIPFFYFHLCNPQINGSVLKSFPIIYFRLFFIKTFILYLSACLTI